MKFFSKQELVGVGIILTVIFFVTGINMNMALLRARDAQRKSDLGAMSNALHSYFEEYGFLPPSEDGYIKACRGEGYEELLQEFEETQKYDNSRLIEKMRICIWGEDPLPDPYDENKLFLAKLYKDPRTDEGYSYYFLSNTKRFQLYTALEEIPDSVGYDESIVARGLSCGTKVCSFGKGFAETPLDRSIDQYEDELRIKNELEKQMRLKNMLQ